MRIEGFCDFDGLSEHLRSCGRPFREGVLEYFRVLGEKSGFSVRENSSIIKYGLVLGRVHLAWVEPKTVFFAEFGVLEDVLKDLWLAAEFEPARVVFLLSGRSKATPKAVADLVGESELAAKIRGKVVLVDVGGRTVKVV